MWLVMSNTGGGTLSQLTVTGGTQLNDNVTIGTGVSTNPYLAIKHGGAYSATAVDYLNLTNSSATTLASITQVSQNLAALAVGRITTQGGRQLRVFQVGANDVRLDVDHHVVEILNISQQLMTTYLPQTPVAGQQYYIKVTTLTSPGTCTLSAGSKTINDAAGTNTSTLPLVLGQAITLVWNPTAAVWMLMSNTAAAVSGNLSVTSVTTSAGIVANGSITTTGTGNISTTGTGKITSAGLLTASSGLTVNGDVNFGTGANLNSALAINHPVSYSAPIYYLNCTNINSTSIASITQVSQTMTALTVGRITTSSGRQLSVTKISTNDSQLGVDHHVVAISNTTGGVFTTKLPEAPVGGQQYYIKVTANTGTCILNGISNPISVDGTTAALTLSLVLGQAIILVWNSTDSMWLVMSNTAGATGGTGGGTLSQLTVTGGTQLNDNVTIGTGVTNPYLAIKHGGAYSATDVDYLNLTNSNGTSIAKITQVSQYLANLTVGG